MKRRIEDIFIPLYAVLGIKLHVNVNLFVCGCDLVDHNVSIFSQKSIKERNAIPKVYQPKNLVKQEQHIFIVILHVS